MMRLKSKLLSLNASKTAKVKVFSPKNCEELRIPFKQDKTAKVVGKLATIPPPTSLSDPTFLPQQLVTGVLVQNDFKLSLMAPEDLREYAGLNTTTITCKQRLRLTAAGVDLVRWGLEGVFGSVEELPEMRMGHPAHDKGVDDAAVANGNGNGAEKVEGDDVDQEMGEEAADEEVARLVAAYLVMGCVAVRYRSDGEVELEWEGNMLNDGIADAVMACLFSIESSPAAVKRMFLFFLITMTSCLQEFLSRFANHLYLLRLRGLPQPRPRAGPETSPQEPPRKRPSHRTPRALPHVPRSTVRRRQR